MTYVGYRFVALGPKELPVRDARDWKSIAIETPVSRERAKAGKSSNTLWDIAY
jgi:hypothetical protein